MQISLSPVRSDETLTVSRAGDVLTVNGELFDFTQLPEGATLPAEAIASDHFPGPVERIDGVLHLTLRLPHPANAPHAMRFPLPIVMTADGVVPLPEPEPEPEPETAE